MLSDVSYTFLACILAFFLALIAALHIYSVDIILGVLSYVFACVVVRTASTLSDSP